MKKRILFVDDEVILTRMIKLNLEKIGKYEIETENHGANAINVIKRFKPDLVFLDVMMPDMTGDEIAAQLLEDPELSSIKYIFMTAIVTKDETESMGNNIGGRQFIAKPVKINELIEIIDKNTE